MTPLCAVSLASSLLEHIISDVSIDDDVLKELGLFDQDMCKILLDWFISEIQEASFLSWRDSMTGMDSLPEYTNIWATTIAHYLIDKVEHFPLES